MNEILSDLRTAVNSIEQFYYHVPSVVVDNDELKIDLEVSKSYERRFVSQLKSEYDRLIQNGGIGNYEEVKTDLEVIKRYIYSSDPDPLIVKCYKRLSRTGSNRLFEIITAIPDFFIHKQQDNFNEAFQKLVVEVKTAPTVDETDFFLDLFKLNVYVEKYNFQNGVFLITNNEIERVKGLAKTYLRQRLYLAPQKKDRIYLFIKPNFQSRIEILKLTDV